MHEKQSNIQKSQEGIQQKEILLPSFDVVTISGHPGTGKTVNGQKIAEMLGVPFIKVGDAFREHVRKTRGIEITGYVERSDEEDIELDTWQRELMTQAIASHSPIIIEGRLANIIATEMIDESAKADLPRPNIVRTLFTANRKERYRRIKNRSPEKSLRQIRSETINREQGDLHQWRKFHPILRKYKEKKIEDLYDPGIKGFWDVWINTSSLSIDETQRELLLQYIENGHIIVQKPDEKTSFPESGIIYESPNVFF